MSLKYLVQFLHEQCAHGLIQVALHGIVDLRHAQFLLHRTEELDALLALLQPSALQLADRLGWLPASILAIVRLED